MPKVQVRPKFKHIKCHLPEYAHDTDAGLDLRADLAEPLVIDPSRVVTVPTGLYIALPEGGADQHGHWVWRLSITPRSGLAARYGIMVANSPGTVDAGYRGEVKVLLLNSYLEPYRVNPGDKIAQAVLERAYKVQWQLELDLPESDRGAAGFGSTGLS